MVGGICGEFRNLEVTQHGCDGGWELREGSLREKWGWL